MTKEQAIERLKIKLDNDKKYLEQCNPFSDLVNEVRLDNKSIEIVFSMLEEKNKEIQFQKEINKTEQNRHKQTEKSLKGQLKKKDNKIALLEQLYKELQNDFDNFKKDKDINYLDGIHHKKLVEKSIGQIIDKPEECWFDIFEVKVIKNNKLYEVAINEDFVTLKQISDESPEECITVIAESPLSGTIYRYNNYGDKKWQLIGTMLGYA